MKKLDDLRNSLDNLDNAFVSILAERFKITHEVGVFKANNNLPVIDRERERKQFDRVREMALTHGLDPEIAEKVLRLIIDEVVKKHEIIQGSVE